MGGGGRGEPSFSCLKKRWLKDSHTVHWGLALKNYVILYLIFNVTALRMHTKATQFFKISPRIVGFVN